MKRSFQPTSPTRILAIDDDADVLSAYQAIFSMGTAETTIANTLDKLLGTPQTECKTEPPPPLSSLFELSTINSGEKGFQMLTEASREGRPYSVVYLDMRIPPGWDGLKTAEMIRSVDQTVRIILITAYSDYSMTAIRSRIGVDFHFLNKPVDKKELLQLTQMLVDQWNQFNELQFYREQLENQVSDLRNQVAEMDEEEKKLNQLARTDALTGVCNRLVLEERFKEAQIRVNRSPKMLGILLLDLDKFKEVNDTEGHHVGDAFLIETAKRLVQEVRQSDVVIRLGGDEFCILAEGLTEDGVTILIQRLRMSLESSFIFEDKNYLIHCSIGYTLALSGTETLETLMKQADQSMYEEKRRKR